MHPQTNQCNIVRVNLSMEYEWLHLAYRFLVVLVHTTKAEALKLCHSSIHPEANWPHETSSIVTAAAYMSTKT